jgi:hypothetical protein
MQWNILPQVGQDADSGEAVHVVTGRLRLENCLVEAASNTAFYVSGEGAALELDLCVLDGLESCQRAVQLSGPRTSLRLEHCIVSDMFSLLTTTNAGTDADVSVRLSGCFLSDLQEGVRLVMPEGSVALHIFASQAELVLYDAECGTSSAVEVAARAGRLDLHNTRLNFGHCDGRGLAVGWAGPEGTVEVERCTVTATGEVPRALAVGEGVAMRGGAGVILRNVHIDGFRLGVRLEGTDSARLEDLEVSCCSVGVFLPPAPQAATVRLASSTFRTLYYGVLGEQADAALHLSGIRFIDVPKALLLSPGMVRSLQEEDCRYLLSRQYLEGEDPALLEAEMNLYLATQENLPHRVAYSHQQINLVSRMQQLNLSL